MAQPTYFPVLFFALCEVGWEEGTSLPLGLAEETREEEEPLREALYTALVA